MFDAASVGAGVVLGSTIIDTDSTLINTAILNKEGYQRVSPYISYRDLLNIPAGAISIEYGLKVCSSRPLAFLVHLPAVLLLASVQLRQVQ